MKSVSPYFETRTSKLIAGFCSEKSNTICLDENIYYEAPRMFKNIAARGIRCLGAPNIQIFHVAVVLFILVITPLYARQHQRLQKRSQAFSQALAKGCVESHNGDSFNYVPSIMYTDKGNAWVSANQTGARKMECTNTCEEKFGEDASVLWKVKKSGNRRLPPLIGFGLNGTEISPEAHFVCRREFTKALGEEEFPEIKEMRNIEHDIYSLPPSKSPKTLKAREAKLRKIFEAKAKRFATCPKGLVLTDSGVQQDGFPGNENLAWICISAEDITERKICPAPMIPTVQSGLSIPSETKIGNKTFVFVSADISCAPEACPAESTHRDHVCVICPKETTFDAKESKAAREHRGITGYLCKGDRKVVEKLYGTEERDRIEAAENAKVEAEREVARKEGRLEEWEQQRRAKDREEEEAVARVQHNAKEERLKQLREKGEVLDAKMRAWYSKPPEERIEYCKKKGIDDPEECGSQTYIDVDAYADKVEQPTNRTVASTPPTTATGPTLSKLELDEQQLYKLKLELPQTKLVENLQKKVTLLKELEAEYLKTAGQNDDTFFVAYASLSKAYHHVATEVQNALVPGDLTPEQTERYHAEVAKQMVAPFNEKARSYAQECLSRATTLGIINKQTSICQEVGNEVGVTKRD